MPTEQIVEGPATHAARPDVEHLAAFELPPSALPAEVVGPDGASPRWARLALLALLVTTAGTYLWNLAASGYGNSFYAAAVEAGSKSWKAMFFGSLDPSNFITVDKPPAALWVMDLSARIFGFSTWSVMVPGVLEGVAAVALLYGAVRRVANPTAGLVAGALLAATPVAALMFRFDNPDALLVLLLVGAAYCMTRAIEKAGTKWLLAVGMLLGFAFLTKMMQAFTVVPAFGLAYLIAAPTSLRRRAVQLLGSLAALVIAGGWWVVIVSLVPAADRPFIDGSPDNSIWNLIFVYNGFGRLSGSGTGGGANFSGTAGVFRLFNDAMGGQASWLLPAALVGLVAVLVARRRAPRTDKVRAAAIVWGGWLLVTGAVFSYGKGVIHTYYTVALAPAIAALVAIGAHQLWKERDHIWARAVAAGAVAADGRVGLGVARPDAFVESGVAVDRRRRRRHRRRHDHGLRRPCSGAGAGAGIAIAALVGVACLTGPVGVHRRHHRHIAHGQHPDRRAGHGARIRRRRIAGWRRRVPGWRRGRWSSHGRQFDGPAYVGPRIPGWCRTRDGQGINGRTPFRAGRSTLGAVPASGRAASGRSGGGAAAQGQGERSGVGAGGGGSDDERRLGACPRVRRLALQVGRGGRGVTERRQSRTGDLGRPGHGDRRLQRARGKSLPLRLQGVRREGRDPLLHRRVIGRWRQGARARRSPSGWRHTSRRRPSAARRCTT